VKLILQGNRETDFLEEYRPDAPFSGTYGDEQQARRD
jgi:hypothetical protein